MTMKNIFRPLLALFLLISTTTRVKAQPGFDEIDQATQQTLEMLENMFGDMEGFAEGVGPAFEAFRNGMGLVRDGLEFYFMSNRPGSIPNAQGNPSYDVWVSTRTSTAEPWRPVSPPRCR